MLSSLLFNLIYNNKHHEQKIDLFDLCYLLLIFVGNSIHCSRLRNGLYRALLFTAGRMFLGFMALIPFFFIFEFKKIKGKKISYNFILIYITLLAFFLSGGFALQQYSLLYTDVANAAIFTIFYVLIVPAISYFLFSKKIHWSVWPSVFVCIIGGYLLTEVNNVTVRLGDSLVLLDLFLGFSYCLFIKIFKII